MTVPKTTFRLLVSCPDRPGIVAAVTQFLCDSDANITHLDQHSTDPDGGQFFMRVEFQCDSDAAQLDAMRTQFGRDIAQRFDMAWQINSARGAKRIVVCVSRHDHALFELMWLWSRHELGADIGAVVSNHPDLRAAVEGFGLDYHHIPVTAGAKPQAEQQLREVMAAVDADLLVLARYMQVLSPDLVQAYPGRIINIHHSFLPAFIGADPYRQAYERGVKIIGATAHYVTERLDEGPIIEQDIVRVTHRDGVATLKRNGRGLERRVLARAVQWHLQDRVILNGSKTIVFR